MLQHLPKYFTSKAIALYIILLIVNSIVFFSNILTWYWFVFGIVEVTSFFYFSNILTRKWSFIKDKFFKKKLFQTAFIIRLVWVIFSYIFYQLMTGKPFEFGTADAFMYHSNASEVADGFWGGYLAEAWHDNIGKWYGISDLGYYFYLSAVYAASFKSILIVRIIKALLSALTCVFVYKLAVRNFGESVGRMAGIFCMLMPNLILYTGIHLKETEMVFLTVWFVERADFLIRNKKFSFITLFPTLSLIVSLFLFRTVLGATAIFALFTTLTFSSSRVLGFGKRMMLAVWLMGVVLYFMGGSIATEVESVWNTRANNQQKSLDWRSKREGGNQFSKYAGASVFAPMIFVIPFPTIVETPKQENQKIINGGNYVKNIMAFFVIFALFWIIKKRIRRDYLLIGSFTIGYLMIIAMSAFAQSERFHLPALPFELILAAFGVSLVTNKSKNYFIWWMVLIFFAIVGWSWFKLAGRGLE